MKRVSGVAHVHSRFSRDGLLTIEELAKTAKSRGLAFLLITEHGEDLNSETFAAMVAECADVSKNSGILVIPGIEAPVDEGFFLLCYGYDGDWIPPGLPLEKTIRIARDGGAVTVMANLSRYPHLIDIEAPDKLDGVEVWNNDYDGPTPREDLLASYRRRFPRDKPFAFGGADLHQPIAFEQCPLIHCRVDNVGATDILQAIRTGEFYSENSLVRLDPDGTLTPRSRLKYRLHALKRSLSAQKKVRMAMKSARRAIQLMRKMFDEGQCEPALADAPQGEKIMVLSPHPDDEALGAGGALLRSVQNRCDITLAAVTDGEAGVAGMKSREVAHARQSRQDEVARRIGVRDVIRFHLPDGSRDFSGELAPKLVETIKSCMPAHIFVPHPADGRPDHQATASALSEALSKTEGTARITVWCYEIWTPLIPNVLVDITDVAEEKRNLIKIYDAQERLRGYADGALGLNAYRATTVEPPHVRYAEAFVRLSAREYIRLANEIRL